jgi:hypothetical protein
LYFIANIKQLIFFKAQRWDENKLDLEAMEGVKGGGAWTVLTF